MAVITIAPIDASVSPGRDARGDAKPRHRRTTAPGRAHLIGIGGAGMTALAEVLSARGWQVSGSDAVDPDPTRLLRHTATRLTLGHAAHRVPDDADVVVYSGAIPEQNAERIAASQAGLAVLSYAEMLGRLTEESRGICIAGTHGKSSTAAMTAHILCEAGMDPSAVVGAQLRNWGGSSGRSGRGEWFVAESCEYRRSFLHLHPSAGAILGIEPDHFDCYKGADDLLDAFGRFARRVPAQGLVVVNDDCAQAQEAVRGIDASVHRFSVLRPADWWAADLRSRQGRYRFRVFHRDRFHSEITLSVAGRHQVSNALAAVALADWAGVAPAVICDALRGFCGIARRFEVIGSWRGVTLVDDYAHHPTEVRATLETARQCFGRRRIWCVFQPHQVSRTAALRNEFADSFHDADRVLVNDIYQARETAGNRNEDGSDRISAPRLASMIAGNGVEVIPAYSTQQIIKELQQQLQPGDVLITMGAGDVGNLSEAFLERLPRDHHTR